MFLILNTYIAFLGISLFVMVVLFPSINYIGYVNSVIISKIDVVVFFLLAFIIVISYIIQSNNTFFIRYIKLLGEKLITETKLQKIIKKQRETNPKYKVLQAIKFQFW